MRHKLEIPWTLRLPVTQWWIRRHSPMASYTASSQGDMREAANTGLSNGRVPEHCAEKEQI